MSYIGAAILILSLLFIAGAGWYWLFKRFERRISERFDYLTERANELSWMPLRVDETVERLNNLELEAERMKEMATDMDSKLDLLQGLLLVIKHDRFLEATARAGKEYRESGEISPEQLDKLNEMLKEMRLENLSRY